MSFGAKQSNKLQFVSTPSCPSRPTRWHVKNIKVFQDFCLPLPCGWGVLYHGMWRGVFDLDNRRWNRSEFHTKLQSGKKNWRYEAGRETQTVILKWIYGNTLWRCAVGLSASILGESAVSCDNRNEVMERKGKGFNTPWLWGCQNGLYCVGLVPSWALLN